MSNGTAYIKKRVALCEMAQRNVEWYCVHTNSEPDCAAADIRGTEVVISTLPLQLKRVPSNSITDSRVVTRYMRSGITAPGSGITTLGIGISSVFVESGIKIVNVFGIRDQNSQCFCDQGLKFSTSLWSGIKIWGKNAGSVKKKNTLLRPWDSSGNKVNPFSQRAKFVTKPSHIPAAKFAQTQTVMIDAAFKTGEINPCSEKARGMVSRTSFDKWRGEFNCKEWASLAAKANLAQLHSVLVL